VIDWARSYYRILRLIAFDPEGQTLDLLLLLQSLLADANNVRQ